LTDEYLEAIEYAYKESYLPETRCHIYLYTDERAINVGSLLLMTS